MVIDDEPLARSRLRELLQRERDIDVVGEAGSGTEAVAEIGRLRPIWYSSMCYAGGKTDRVLASLDEAPPAIVFGTA